MSDDTGDTRDTREEIQRQYSRGGAEYDRVRLAEPRGLWLTEYDVDLFERLLPAAAPGARALEVGAGTGRFTLPTLAKGYEVVASDINQAQLDQLKERLNETGQAAACTVETQSIFEIDYPDASFDLVVSIHVVPRLLTWEDQRAALRELCRVLKPGGLLLFNYRNGQSPYRFIYKGPSALPADVDRTLHEGGVEARSVLTKHLLNGRLLDRLPRALWGPLTSVDRMMETILPGLAWDVFMLGQKV